MSFAATAVVVVLFALALLPLLWVLRPRMGARWAVMAFSGAIVAIAVYHTGIIAPSSTANADVANLVPQESARGRCQEVLQLVADAGIVLETAETDKLVVRAEGWQQLPPAVRDAVVDCATQLSSGGGEGGEIEVIQR
jgi:hypothetical protein